MSDLLLLDPQEVHRPAVALALRYASTVQRAWAGRWAWTMWAASGVPLACCGIHEGRAWAILGRDLRRYMVPLTRAVRIALEAHAAAEGPVTADVDEGHPEAVRWTTFLGFRREAPGVWRFG